MQLKITNVCSVAIRSTTSSLNHHYKTQLITKNCSEAKWRVQRQSEARAEETTRQTTMDPIANTIVLLKQTEEGSSLSEARREIKERNKVTNIQSKPIDFHDRIRKMPTMFRNICFLELSKEFPGDTKTSSN